MKRKGKERKMGDELSYAMLMGRRSASRALLLLLSMVGKGVAATPPWHVSRALYIHTHTHTHGLCGWWCLGETPAVYIDCTCLASGIG